jgi:hypothetical protein
MMLTLNMEHAFVDCPTHVANQQHCAEARLDMLEGSSCAMKHHQPEKMSVQIRKQYDLWGLTEDHLDDMLDDLLDAWKQKQRQSEHIGFLQRKLADSSTWTIFEPAARGVVPEAPLTAVSAEADTPLPEAPDEKEPTEKSTEDVTEFELKLQQEMKSLPGFEQILSQISTTDSLPKMSTTDSLPKCDPQPAVYLSEGMSSLGEAEAEDTYPSLRALDEAAAHLQGLIKAALCRDTKSISESTQVDALVFDATMRRKVERTGKNRLLAFA